MTLELYEKVRLGWNQLDKLFSTWGKDDLLKFEQQNNLDKPKKGSGHLEKKL